MEEKTLSQIKQLIESAYLSLQEARELLDRNSPRGSLLPFSVHTDQATPSSIETSSGSIVQGMFDGQMMISGDGKKYPVPANYASKSKLVQGDLLKLTIKHDGAFQFKQVGPVERKRLKGVLFRDNETEQYRVVAEERSYKVLAASISYFKGEAGDEAIILVPQNALSEWAAVEHVLKASTAKQVSDPQSFIQPSAPNGESLRNFEASAAEIPLRAPEVQEQNLPPDEIDFVDRI